MTNPFQRSRSYRTVTQSLILCAVMCITLATPVTTHISSQDVPEVSPQEQHQIIQQYTCIHTALYREARGEPTEGVRAVLSVIQNRKNHKNYPDTYCAVIKQPYQFSFYNTIKHDKTAYSASEAKVRATIASLAFEAAVGRFKGTLDPSVVMYHAKNIKNLPAWSTRAKFVVTIQNHQFYRS